MLANPGNPGLTQSGTATLPALLALSMSQQTHCPHCCYTASNAARIVVAQVRLAVFSQHHVEGLDLALTPLAAMQRAFPNVKVRRGCCVCVCALCSMSKLSRDFLPRTLEILLFLRSPAVC
jgi:hypothetical protein